MMNIKKVNNFWFPKEDIYCSGSIFKEIHKIAIISDLCEKKDVVVQAGGNVGVFPIELSKTFKKVYTFEPDPSLFNLLLKNLEEHNITNVTAYNYALSNTSEQGDMEQPVKGYSMYKNAGSITFQKNSKGNISSIQLDAYNFGSVDLLYLDIEGHEYNALLGAEDTINKFKPVIVAENKGLIFNFSEETDLNGSKKFRQAVQERFNYKLKDRLMRDDVFIFADIV